MKKNINLEIGERIRLARTTRGLSREKLAELLGISTLFLGYIECGQRGMSLATLQNMCKVLNVSADYLLLGRNDEGNEEALLSAVKELEPQYVPLAIEQINNLKKTIAVIRHQECR